MIKYNQERQKMKTIRKHQIPLVIEVDEDGFYVVECPLFSGCYTQGRTFDEAIKNIREVIALCLEDDDNKKIWQDYQPKDFSFYTLNYA